MKKQSLLGFMLAVLLVITSIGTTVFADEPVKVNVDDQALNLDTQPQIIDGRTMVPLRGILEALGLELKWDAATKTVTASNKDYSIVLPIGSKTASVNGKEVELDVPAQVTSNGRTMVPARFISESAGAKVDWDAGSKTVNIKSENYSRSVNNTTNISNVTGSTININNNNVDNSVNNSNNTYNNYDYSTKINNNITTNTNVTSLGNMDEIMKQIGMQDTMKNSAQLQIKYTVVDKADNKPLKGAVLFLNGSAAGISDDKGEISFGVYAYAANLIKVAKEGYKDFQTTKSYTSKMEDTISLEAGTSNLKISDPNLEKAIRDALNKPNGDLNENDYVKIEGLCAPGLQIKSLEGIQNLTSLVALNLSDNEISDLKPLSALKNLKHLSIDNNKITDISSLSGLTGLEDLAAGLNNIIDLQPLGTLTGMKNLHLWSNSNLSDISVLSKLTNLTGANLDGTKITDINPLGGLTKLNWLRLMVDAPVSISPVKDIKSLTYLCVDMHKTPDLSVVINMAQLQRLGLKDVTDDDIQKLEPIFSKLDTLELQSPKISDYAKIQSFTALHGLSIRNAAISDLGFLSAFPHLTYLDFSWDSLNSVSFLSSIPELNSLQLDGNNITDVSAVGTLSKLTWLSLQNNKITDVSALSNLTGLNSLFLYNNQIKDYSSLSKIYADLKEKDFNLK